ncbi:fused MFS/spermidine synthase [Nisaea acidiphila]|uniref:Fused MFS/spermidine synthase n=1 Tax=Nisaea acidiphila TaxID=1862145 RepID=A0A9J7AWN5_9PROT|nr:fused MFS/spermidine synthase [Nisaea acidiphila]UUX51534.1 fused MFS/spermidine synthase [Nisaea acidiphila]
MSFAIRLFLAAVLFLGSAGGLVVEIVAGRLIAPYVGMSLYTWTAIIAVVLAGLSVGHWIGGRMAGPDVDRQSGLRRLAGALALAGLGSLLALVFLNDLAVSLLASGLGQVTIVVLLTTALFLLPSLFVGMVAPIVTKLAVDEEPDNTGAVLGRMYAIGTVGSIGGTLSAGYLFISWIGSSGTLIAVTALYAVLALACALLAGRKAALAAVAALLVAGLPLVGTGLAREAFTSRCTVESDYFCIVIDDFAPYSGRPSKLMVLDNLVHSINDRADPSLLYSPYIHFVDEYARRRFPLDVPGASFSAFFIGGGGYSLPRSWAATVPGARLLVAEIDPAVTQAAERHLWLDPSAEGLEIHHRDARGLLQSLRPVPQFDVIFGDAFHDISVPTHLVSREFHREVAVRLKPDGFYVVNVVDGARNPQFLAALTHTLALDFEDVSVWREAGESTGFSPDGRITYEVVAASSAAPVSAIRSIFGIRRTWQRIRLADLMDAGAPSPVVLTDDYAPVDRLLSPVLFSSVSTE